MYVNVPDDACPDTHHIERHDDHEVYADTSARRGKLPVLLNEIPVEGSELLHRNETENHHGEDSRQDEGNLSKRMMEKGGVHMFKNRFNYHIL